MGPVAAGAGAATGAAGLLPIAGMLLYGVTTTWSNMSDSIKQTIEEEGSFSFSGFFANFFGGDDKGGFMNAMRQAFKIGGTGALIGMGIGAAIGLGSPLSIPFAIMGGLIGMGVGLLTGAIAGYMGSDKIKAFTTKVGDMITDTVDAIGGFFANVFAGMKSFMKGEGFMKGYNDSRYKDKSKTERELMDLQDEIAALEAGTSGYTDERAAELLVTKKAKAEDLMLYIEDAPQQSINDARAKLEKRNANLRKLITANEQFGGYGSEEMNKVPKAELANNVADLKLMPNYQDTLRTQKENLEKIKVSLEKEAARKANALKYESFDSMPLGAQSGLQPVLIDKGQVNNYNSNYGSRLNVDNGNSTSRLFGDSLLIDVRGSLAGQ